MRADLFQGVQPFVVVAEERSFRRAAVRLGVSPAAVSKAIQRLEAQVGLTLIIRTTRAVSLTREGEVFFERCRAAVAAVEGAREAIEPLGSQPEGQLVISAPFVAAPLLGPSLALLRARCPKLVVSLKMTDQISKLAEESIDVAVRIGALPASSLIARKVRRTTLWTVAAPAYLARRGVPGRIDQLAAHECLSLVAPTGKPHPWVFAKGLQPVTNVLTVDHGPSLIDAALAGVGVAQAFDFMVEALVAEGRLVQLLADQVGQGPDVHALCVPGRKATPRIKAAFAAFADTFQAER